VAQSFGYNAVFIWVIGDNSPSLALVFFRFISHSFIMPLFFLISGFSADSLLQKLGVLGCTRNRIKRVLVPFIVSWLLLYPLVTLLGWLEHQNLVIGMLWVCLWRCAPFPLGN
jgi:fucose 4-O-acetylase-like acetyltransferase